MSLETRPEDQRIDMGALWGAILSRWFRVIVVTLLAVGVAFAVLLFVPKQYESTAGLLVEQRTNIATSGQGGGTSQPSIPVEAMMSSQIELIRSRDTLMSVIDRENLRSEPEFTGIGLSPVTLVLQLIGRPPEPSSVDETVIQNLLDNAIKYAGGSKGEAVVRVVLKADAGGVRLSVCDNGPGVPAEKRAEVIKRFVRLDASRSKPGTGLGLSLVEAVMELHGGSLTLAATEPDREETPGLTATMVFPPLAS